MSEGRSAGGCMLPRSGARVALALALLVGVSYLAPLAMADHAYSHRYIIFGRVSDANGDPVPNLTVNLNYFDFKPETPCGYQPGTQTEAFGRTENTPPWDGVSQPVRAFTNQFGEFIFCFHTHPLSRTLPGSGRLEIPEADNFARDITFDANTRQQFVDLQLPTARDDANKLVNSAYYTVYGRLWRPDSSDPQVEGIRVFGKTLNQVPVNVTLTLDNGTVIERTAHTNNYGDFSIRLNLTAKPAGGKVKITAEGESFEAAISDKSSVTAFRAQFAKQSDPFLQTAGIVVGVIVALGAVVGGGIYGYRKMSTRREEERIRAKSQRKRANK